MPSQIPLKKGNLSPSEGKTKTKEKPRGHVQTRVFSSSKASFEQIFTNDAIGEVTNMTKNYTSKKCASLSP